MVVSQTEFPPSIKSEDTFNSFLLSQPENHYLYLAATVGLLGLAAFLAVLLIFLYLGFRLLCKSPGRDGIYLTSAFIAAVAQYCVHILFNPTAILPEFMFWLIMALMIVLSRIEMPGNSDAERADNGLPLTGIAERTDSGKIRKAIAVLIVIVFMGVGFSLTFSPALADMQLSRAVHTWSKDTGKTLSALAEAANLEPGEAVYYGYIGSYAFNLAVNSTDAIEKSKLLSLSVAAYTAAGTREPYLAYWSYMIADVYTYMAGHNAPDKWQDALRYYERADILLPGNAVILNKWALALMVKGDYAAVEQKLQEAEKNDPSWVQTSFYRGLLRIYEGHNDAAGGTFVSPVKNQPDNIGYFINFCLQAGTYGGIEHVVDALSTYVSSNGSDWLGWAMLGIADIHANRIDDAVAALHKSAKLVPDQDIAGLKSIVREVSHGNKGFQAAAEDILSLLNARVEK